MNCCEKQVATNDPSEFERVIKAFWAEAALNGPDQVLLQAGHRNVLINACRRELADRWEDVTDLLGADSVSHLRYVYLVLSQMFPASVYKATPLDMDLRVSGTVQVNANIEINILA